MNERIRFLLYCRKEKRVTEKLKIIYVNTSIEKLDT